MANVYLQDSTLTSIADAIRSKLQTTDTYRPGQMPAAIQSISGGGTSTTMTPIIGPRVQATSSSFPDIRSQMVGVGDRIIFYISSLGTFSRSSGSSFSFGIKYLDIFKDNSVSRITSNDYISDRISISYSADSIGVTFANGIGHCFFDTYNQTPTFLDSTDILSDDTASLNTTRRYLGFEFLITEEFLGAINADMVSITLASSQTFTSNTFYASCDIIRGSDISQPLSNVAYKALGYYGGTQQVAPSVTLNQNQLGFITRRNSSLNSSYKDYFPPCGLDADCVILNTGFPVEQTYAHGSAYSVFDGGTINLPKEHLLIPAETNNVLLFVAICDIPV